ncbi:MAG: NrfD/PsrC family molybdoenzyme membrane anchor subunit [Chloroflexota bacterium]
MTLKRILYIASILATVVGLYGVFLRFTTGHQEAAYGSYVVWGLWVAMYLFYVGITAGAVVLASLDYVLHLPLFRGTGRLSLVLALITLGAGLFHIWLDLGHLERIWKVYLQGNPFSVMMQIVLGYTLLGLMMLVALYLTLRKPEGMILKWLLILAIPLALFLSGGVGALLGVQAARLFWHVGLFPAQFPVFSLASGVAVLLLTLGFFWDRRDPRLPQMLLVLGISSVVLQVVKLYFLWADFSQSLYGGVPHNVQAVQEVLFGPYWWAFWFGQVLIGALVPIAVLSQPRLARNPLWAGWMGAAILLGFAIARANIVFPALTVPELAALTTAFSDPRLEYRYFPSLMEWAVSVGITGAAGLTFLLAERWLPLVQVE